MTRLLDAKHRTVEQVQFVREVLSQIYLIVKGSKQNPVSARTNNHLYEVHRRFLLEFEFSSGRRRCVHQHGYIQRQGFSEIVGKRLNPLRNFIFKDDEVALSKARHKLSLLIDHSDRKTNAPNRDLY